jgi:serine/threonine-protein kinase
VYYRVLHDYRRALAEFEIALKGMPSDGPLWLVLGATHRRLGNWGETLVTFEKGARIDPRNANIIGDLGGWTYDVLHRYPEAMREYDRALSLAPDARSIAFWRGDAYIRWHGQLDTLRATLSRVPVESEREWFSSRDECLLLERNPDSLLQVREIAHGDVIDDYSHFHPGALYAAWAHQLRGDHQAAQAAFRAALAVLDSAMVELPEDWRLHAARGLTLAGLNRRDEALGEARWLQRSEAFRGDAVAAVLVAEDRARILAQAGDAEAALDEIERLLTEPSFLSVHMLRLDPRWDPIREHPRFKATLTKYGSEAPS